MLIGQLQNQLVTLSLLSHLQSTQGLRDDNLTLAWYGETISKYSTFYLFDFDPGVETHHFHRQLVEEVSTRPLGSRARARINQGTVSGPQLQKPPKDACFVNYI
ncbi:hypothetical protein DTO027B5_6491 [Paecilomyces variotii]|nr:hypothetical protein DTO032I3_6987 [Paecilomyces variotii]KAJ9225205.1 hypothetical protein DTO169C6_2546 [Paecilomyces variotii]KAJ9263577.1 hypothetical protein DTO195F2_2837 [Paecilomyces variotii]KAJ9281107.1 hypothetical protein DTO021D3_2161 [Paecilomyces variotii]KAJ9325249.1 hypothetical protein DTO027B3_3728 [Paecilomyces variotii]